MVIHYKFIKTFFVKFWFFSRITTTLYSLLHSKCVLNPQFSKGLSIIWVFWPFGVIFTIFIFFNFQFFSFLEYLTVTKKTLAITCNRKVTSRHLILPHFEWNFIYIWNKDVAFFLIFLNFVSTKFSQKPTKRI